MKLYLNGKWSEIIMDDFVPCYKIDNKGFEPVLANSRTIEPIWQLIQKLFCK
jgi:hypothetical protein